MPSGWRRTWTAHWPRWTVVIVTLLAMDLCNWLAHWGDHRIGILWRIHALHHSQEELSVLTSFRAHPLMHTTGFVLATVPVLALTGAHPLAPVLITVYVCLGTLPHTNVRWTYGPLGRVWSAPGTTGCTTRWRAAKRSTSGSPSPCGTCSPARPASPQGRGARATGLTDRPVAVEQAGRGPRRPAPACLLGRQLAQPFNAA